MTARRSIPVQAAAVVDQMSGRLPDPVVGRTTKSLRRVGLNMAQTSYSPGSPDRWLVLFLAALSYFTLYLHRSLVNYLQPPIQATFDVSNEAIGLLSTAFLLPYTMVQIGVGYLSDRLSRRAVLLFS